RASATTAEMSARRCLRAVDMVPLQWRCPGRGRADESVGRPCLIEGPDSEPVLEDYQRAGYGNPATRNATGPHRTDTPSLRGRTTAASAATEQQLELHDAVILDRQHDERLGPLDRVVGEEDVDRTGHGHDVAGQA